MSVPSGPWRMTDAQLGYIRSLLHQLRISRLELATLIDDRQVETLTKDEASALIEALVGVRDGTRPRPVPKAQLSLKGL